MNTVAHLLSALALSATFVAAPLMASADETPAAAAHGKKGGHRTHDKQKPSFPMTADQFRAKVEKRIEKVKARVDRALDKHNVPAAQRAEVSKAMEGAAKEVRGAVEKVGTDGVVTKDEAKQVKDLAKQLRAKAKELLKAKGIEPKGGKGHHGKKGEKA